VSGVLAFLVALAVVATAEAGPGRADALAALAAPDVEARRVGAAALAQVGEPDDAPALVRGLRDADAQVRRLAERALWAVWSRSGDATIDHILEIGVAQMREGQIEASVETFSDIIRRRPDFAEGWNKRATAYYLLGDWRRSAADCDEVLKRNPGHFGALSGLGEIYLQLDDEAKALEWYRRALEVNPNMVGVEMKIRMLEERRKAQPAPGRST
jgi:tetratricopeptide (TPR) repeat protein